MILIILMVIVEGNLYEPICNPTFGFCTQFYNQTKTPNMFGHTNYTFVHGKC